MGYFLLYGELQELKKIILYSNGCPRCNVLKNKLNDKGIEYTISDNFDVLIEKGLQTAPILSIDNELYQFGDAVKVIDTL